MDYLAIAVICCVSCVLVPFVILLVPVVMYYYVRSIERLHKVLNEYIKRVEANEAPGEPAEEFEEVTLSGNDNPPTTDEAQST